MNIVRAQVVMAKKSGISKDAVVNTWHFDTGGEDTSDDRTAIGDNLIAFYNAIGTHLSESLSTTTNDNRLKLYQLGGAGDFGPASLAGSPVVTRDWTLAAGGGGSLPAEVAICLSMKGNTTNVQEESGATRPAARRRGRVFLGPFDLGSLTTDVATGEAIVASATRTAILDAAETMFEALRGLTAPIYPVVLSRTANTAYAVESISVDEAFDTQRRRGISPSVKTTRVLAPALALGA